MPNIDEEMWENLPPSFKLYCKKICNENKYKTDSEPTTTTTTLQGHSANQAETVPTVTTVKGKEIAINSLRRLNVINEGVEEMTMNTTTKGALMDSGANGGMAGSDMRIFELSRSGSCPCNRYCGNLASRSAHSYQGSFDRDHAWSSYRHFPPECVLR